MTPAQIENILKKQLENWPRAVALGKEGNPFATLCTHCYGRHKPPMDEICAHDPKPPQSYPQESEQ